MTGSCRSIRYVPIVSIHTPTQGVTTHAGHSPQYRNVSIHTPTQGVTGGGFLFFLSRKSFNPHTHAGCDYGWHLDYSLTEKVSIHTPTQGVTSSQSDVFDSAKVSIHTPTQGVTTVDS